MQGIEELLFQRFRFPDWNLIGNLVIAGVAAWLICQVFASMGREIFFHRCPYCWEKVKGDHEVSCPQRLELQTKKEER